MKILLQISSNQFLPCHEALSMAFALAAFDHEIQLQVGEGMLELLLQSPTDKLANMLRSLDLYDMPPAWLAHDSYLRLHSWQNEQSNRANWLDYLIEMPQVKGDFDAIFDL